MRAGETGLMMYVQDPLPFDISERTTPKARGAFFTDRAVADFLVRWAVRESNEHVMDPSFGEGVFLFAAADRLLQLGGEPSRQVKGIELHPPSFELATRTAGQAYGIPQTAFQQMDFFELLPGAFQVDAVVGNPPFVRYQTFTGVTRKRALQRAESLGVDISALTSSWAPFLVHAVSMVKPGGRLAMVMPFELVHAGYAKPVLAFLTGSFAGVSVLTFEQRLFPKLNEDTILLTADRKGYGPARLAWINCRGPGELGRIDAGQSPQLPGEGTTIDQAALDRGDSRFISYVLPEKVRALYQELCRLPQVNRLGELAYAGIGYVTGANDYFHLTPDEARRWDIPEEFLFAAVRRGRALTGTRFTQADWYTGAATKDTGFLLCISKEHTPPDRLTPYLERGVKLGVPQRYKCRTRSPWYAVPHVSVPDAFLTYMAGAFPKLAVNNAGAVAANTLHLVRAHDPASTPADALAMAWVTSLTRLSAEIEGHALGGGMLKLEPREARQVLIPRVPVRTVEASAAELDETFRRQGPEAARRNANRPILQEGLGLSARDCQLLDRGAELLLNRRSGRSRRGKNAS